ncbi:MAG: two-component sensor histidine kinase [Xanthomonadaceae bacterium]|nr:two-component sensor histidine kinase [Xanthomonadaceae bacterium]
MMRKPDWLTPAPDSAVANTIRRGKSAWTDGIHLLWSVWIFITPMFSGGYTWRWLWLTCATYPVFLLLFAMTLLAPRRAAGFWAVGMAAMGTALLPVYPAAISYFVFGCVMLRPGSHSIVWQMTRLLLLNAVFLAVASRVGYPWQALVWVPVMTMILGIVITIERVNHEKDAALKLSHDEVRRLAGLAERERIGRDLHDLLGHTLSLVALKSELAGKLVTSDPVAARREIHEVTKVAREALTQVRSAVTGIRAAGLAAELASARLLLETDAIAFVYTIVPVLLPPAQEAVFAMTLREAVTNIQRHARARSAQVVLQVDGRDVLLRIVDDGRGGAIAPGNGLCGMRERIEALGGRLRIDSGRQGTCVEARLPLQTTPDRFAPDVPDAAAAS